MVCNSAIDCCLVGTSFGNEEGGQLVGDRHKIFQSLQTIGGGNAVGTDTVVVKVGADDSNILGVIADYRGEKIVLVIDAFFKPEVVLQ